MKPILSMIIFLSTVIGPSAALFAAEEVKTSDAVRTTAEEVGKKSAEAWLKLIDANNSGESWESAAAIFRIQVPKDKWEQSLSSVRDLFGNMIARKLINAQFTKTLPGAPDGNYLVVQYQTAFEK